ncbi:MAG: hypothetical protein GWO20_07175 [Candidatus Korarchaeota archaeon]|nr:hypothetical protein [Candidatus Korarchaeota archaeon]NIU83224.1 hypothetical protein [Candidatus Thorarchaeota archaeon]NIW13170.1 hypothetical protein [Candidatus Thorarchaeota archaeon]NIW51311.1 hypothetical protein [Candidatus Korarchaeota archaeon]
MSKLKAMRDWISRWIMRIQQASSVLQLGWWMVIGISTTILAWEFLEAYQTVVLLISLITGTIVFAYMYDRYRVLLLKQKETSWRASNFLGPSQKMNMLYQRLLFKLSTRYLKAEEMTFEEYEQLVDTKTKELMTQWEARGIPKE